MVPLYLIVSVASAYYSVDEWCANPTLTLKRQPPPPPPPPPPPARNPGRRVACQLTLHREHWHGAYCRYESWSSPMGRLADFTCVANQIFILITAAAEHTVMTR